LEIEGQFTNPELQFRQASMDHEHQRHKNFLQNKYNDILNSNLLNNESLMKEDPKRESSIPIKINMSDCESKSIEM
jgi:hypothetical protein